MIKAAVLSRWHAQFAFNKEAFMNQNIILHLRNWPHQVACEECAALNVCSFCGAALDYRHCTNGLCIECHDKQCTNGGATYPGHNRKPFDIKGP